MKRSHFVIHQSTVFFSAKPARRGTTSPEPAWPGEGKQPSCSIRGRRKQLRSSCEVQRHRFRDRQTSSCTIECFAAPHTSPSHFHGPLSSSSFTPWIMSGYQEENDKVCRWTLGTGEGLMQGRGGRQRRSETAVAVAMDRWDSRHIFQCV